MENNNNQSAASCSSCPAPLSVDSRHRTYQAYRERVAASRRRRRVEDQQEEAGVTTRPRDRPRRTVESVDAESRPRGRLREEPAAYTSQLSRLCPFGPWIWKSCCMRGSVQLQLLPDPPQYLKGLLASTDTQGRHFKDNLRQYNTAFAFTSLDCDIVSAEDRANNTTINSNNSNNNRCGLNAFQIHGALCYRQGPLTPVEGSEPSYAQLYIFDPSYAAERRQARNSNLDPQIIRELSVMLAQCNPFERVYRHAHEILSNH
ncbi:hypothetical protein G6F70_003140 [Rhizopus microsporus]|nr:hypothetical protein G6F71_001289 [Rhizopus microsporus]KAG1201463.1 hypothetical protein G6F70_003140 [Rhizopus microsporus]KAG1213899.1 hypothetical protein G6F69_002398 [Rhizopus microsporus]KAG1235688.1 hypothetical protein G6F67_002561 [Rhizopus microsporus]KAG1267783.1 hypothetical protein G6F68_001638 [Rhizopus microsporus]